MVNFTSLITSFSELVGFRETANTTLSTSLKTSDSGIYVDALSPINADFISSIIPIQQTELSSGSLTIGNWYEITDNTGSDFTSGGAGDNNVGTIFEADAVSVTWGHGTLNTLPVIDYLNRIRIDEINSVIRQWTNQLQSTLGVTNLKANSKLIKQIGTVTQSQSETAKGYYINLSKSNSLKMQINRISLQLDAVDTVRLYLYEFGKTTAIKTFDYTSVDNQIDLQTVTDWLLYYQTNTNAGNEYLLLYYDYDSDNVQSSIQLESGTKYYVSSDNCFQNEPDILRYAYFQPVIIPKSLWNWNVSDYDIPNFENSKPLNYCSSSENGMNIDFNIGCDITNIIIANKQTFAKLIQLAYGIRILTDADTSNRINRSKRVVDEDVAKYLTDYRIELFGHKWMDSEGKPQYISGEITKLINNFKNIDSECFVQKNKTSLITNNFQNTKR